MDVLGFFLILQLMIFKSNMKISQNADCDGLEK